MSQHLISNTIASAAVTFLVSAVVLVIPLIFVLIIWIILGIISLFFAKIGWLAVLFAYLSIGLFCLPFILGLIAGIIGFIWKLFSR